MSRYVFLPYLCFCLLLCCCSTTGDPTQGRLFGWSSGKARQNIDDQKGYLGKDNKVYDASRQRNITLYAEQNAIYKNIKQLRHDIKVIEQEAELLKAQLDDNRVEHKVVKQKAEELLAKLKRVENAAGPNMHVEYHNEGGTTLQNTLEEVLNMPVREGFYRK